MSIGIQKTCQILSVFSRSGSSSGSETRIQSHHRQISITYQIQTVFSLLESLLKLAWCCPCAIQSIQLLESRLCPHTESTDMSTRSQTQDVQSADGDSVYTRNIPECLHYSSVLVINDEWAQSLGSPSVPHLTSACS